MVGGDEAACFAGSDGDCSTSGRSDYGSEELGSVGFESWFVGDFGVRDAEKLGDFDVVGSESVGVLDC